MKHFIILIAAVFIGLTVIYFQNEDRTKKVDDHTLRIYASSSFIAKWGPGPELKALFEKQHIFKIEFVESPDISMTMQKINFEGDRARADLVLGLDQFDIGRLASKIKWKTLDIAYTDQLTDELKSQTDSLLKQKNFVAYDWAPMTLIARRDLGVQIDSLDDLLKPELKGKIALQDPRTSSPGLQFLSWIFESKSAQESIVFLKALTQQVHSFSSSWSAAYGLFKNKQADLVFSYVTSPIYHLVEEKDDSYLALEFKEPLPVQIEFAGVPDGCKNCEGAQIFLKFMLSQEAQKIIMAKNYMMPVVAKVKDSTPFDAVKVFKTRAVQFYDQNQIEKWVNQWSEIRKNEGQ